MTGEVTHYRVRGTKVNSPYPLQLTPAETRLVFSLQHVFDPDNIFPDYYTEKVTARTKAIVAADQFALGAHTGAQLGSNYVQIDCLALDRRGVFVFESKDYSGWIYGNASQASWTVVLNFGREKHSFYNPLRQNALHLAALADFLGPDVPLYSIIVFGPNATLKTTFNPSSPLLERCFVCTQPQLRSLLTKIPHDLQTPSVNLQCASSNSPMSALSDPNAILRTLSDPQLVAVRRALAQHRFLPTALDRRNHIAAINSGTQR